MGLCGVVSDEVAEKTNGLPIGEERYWFVLTPDQTYRAYSLEEDELYQLGLERKYHEATIGCGINHDSTHYGGRRGTIPEEITHDESDLGDVAFSKGTARVFNAKLNLSDDKLAFKFSFEDIINPHPGTIKE